MRNASFSMLFAAVLSLGIVGCSSDKPGVSDPATPIAERKSSTDSEKVAREAKEKKEHDDRIQGFKSRWAAIPEEMKGADWMDEAKGFSKEGLEACDRGKRFSQFNELYSLAMVHPEDAQEAGLSPVAEMRPMYVKSAGDYFVAFSIVATKGSLVACKEGEGYVRGLPFNTSDLEMFLSAMHETKITPEDIGTTPAKIRAVHLALFKRDLPDLKKRIDTDSGDAIGYVRGTMDEWHYKTAELGLTAAQMAKLDPPSKDK